MSFSSSLQVLVVGATGATGCHVVRQLLNKGCTVHVVVRSKERMMMKLSTTSCTTEAINDRLIIQEKSLLSMSDEEMKDQVMNIDVVVSCLGHNLTMEGIWGHPRQLVTEAVQRLTTAMIAVINDKNDDNNNNNNNNKTTPSSSSLTTKKFILMGSDGVAHPMNTDDPRPWYERWLIATLRILIPPHRDNEMAAEYLVRTFERNNNESLAALEWVIVRPTDLIDDEKMMTTEQQQQQQIPEQQQQEPKQEQSEQQQKKESTPLSLSSSSYVIYPRPIGSLFGGGVTSRMNVAKFIVDLITQHDLWNRWKYDMPVIHDVTNHHNDNNNN